MDNRFKVVGESVVPGGKRYRGVYRSLPSYVESARPESDINRAFALMCDKGGQTGCLDDFSDAKTIVAAYANAPKPQHFDIIQVTPVDGSGGASTGELLGFDIAVGGTGFSLLSWGLELSRFAGGDSSILRIRPLIDLTERHFSKRLNKNGLFDSFDDARFFLSCMATLQSLRPNLWESHDMESYEIVAVGLVNAPNSSEYNTTQTDSSP